MSDESHLKLIYNGVSCELCGAQKIIIPNDIDIVIAEIELWRAKHLRKDSGKCRSSVQ